jgi:predicted NBD/HSP70 family sugar kinase
MSLLTIDIGGTKAAFAVIHSNKVIQFQVRSSPSSVTALFEQLRSLFQRHQYDGISIAVAGVVRDHRAVIQSPNLPWLNRIPLALNVEEEFGCPCWLANDMEALGVAELKRGSLCDVRCGLVETISTGWGGCICMRIEGANIVITAEPGHVARSRHGPLCGCRRRGCNEALFSGGAIARDLRVRFGARIPRHIDPCAFLDCAAREKAPWALKLYAKLGREIGLEWANALNRNSWIEKIVFAGTFAVKGIEFLRRHIEAEIARCAVFPQHKSISIMQSSLWPYGAHFGAAMIFENCEKAPRTTCFQPGDKEAPSLRFPVFN